MKVKTNQVRGDQVNPMINITFICGLLTHLLDLFDELVLQLGGQILDRTNNVLLLRALHGGAQDEQQQVIHLRKRPRSRRVLADGQRVGQRHDQALVQHILFRENASEALIK